jgi:precorrin-2 dehydrogenase/sirohydrochlorin ferrochelatase
MDSFPAFIPLDGRKVVVVGEGGAAEAKARLFDGSPAELVHVSLKQALAPGALDGARLVFVAVEDEALATRIAGLARHAGALVNVVDKPALCDFATPAIVDRGAIVAGIGTGGAAPVLATLLRGELEARWPDGLGRLGELSRAIQPEVRAALPELPARRAYWRRLLAGPAAEAALGGDLDRARTLAMEALATPREPAGRVLFLQAPAEPDRLTLAAVRALGDADRIVAGADVDPGVLAYARRDAERSQAATAGELAAWAKRGLVVLRLAALIDEAEVHAVRAAGAAAQHLP